MENMKICPVMRGTFCQRGNCACWHIDHCGLIHDDGLIADRISSQTRLFGVLIGHGIRRAMGEETAEDTKELEDMDQLIEDMSRSNSGHALIAARISTPASAATANKKCRQGCDQHPRRQAVNSFSRANVPHIIVSKQEEKSNDLQPQKA